MPIPKIERLPLDKTLYVLQSQRYRSYNVCL